MAVITVSRQFGSGGTEIATLVSRRLGYTYVDKQIIAEAARKAGLPAGGEVEFKELHSELRSFIDRLLYPGPYIVAQVSVREGEGNGISVEELDKAEALTLVRGAIHAAYQKGDAVIVGRGGQAVLKGIPGVLHVRMVAPLPFRILQVQQSLGVDLETAREEIAKRDRRSGSYLKEVFDIDWDDPLLYHMVINTARWDPAAAARLIVEAVDALQASPVPA